MKLDFQKGNVLNTGIMGQISVQVVAVIHLCPIFAFAFISPPADKFSHVTNIDFEAAFLLLETLNWDQMKALAGKTLLTPSAKGLLYSAR